MIGGVSSPVRAFKGVGGKPIIIRKGKGPKIWDVDGNSYIDYMCSWGALIHGHSHPKILNGIQRTIHEGTSFGTTTEEEILLAEKIIKLIPSVEKVRFVNSGTEATMSAVRLARAYTKRKKIVKFEGCYHGHADHFLSKSGSGLATLAIPSSLGIPEEVVYNTITLPYNDLDALEHLFKVSGDEIAAIIVEPIAGNMGVVKPEHGFLHGLRKICDNYGSLLIFDEVITGFRVSSGGAQSLYNVRPDITCLGKIIGGGFPVGAYGGDKKIMGLIAPEGQVYQAGTLSGNPVAMRAGFVALSLLDNKAYRKLDAISKELEEGLLEASRSVGIDITINRVGSMLSLFFTRDQVKSFNDVMNSNHRLYPKLFWGMLNRGVYLPPSPFESIFLSTVHTEIDIEHTIKAARDSFKLLR